ncbi:MAG: bifunctional metallophosphatase/5'-nucleotidase [Anaerolineae bacterium]
MPQRLNRRAFLRRLLLATGSVALSGCTRDLLPQAGGSVALTLLHLNDLHGALYARSTDGDGRGGAANLVGMIERMRARATGPVVLLDAGDAFQGTYVSNSNRGAAVVELMNLAGVNAMALGNHEFDWGLDVLRARIDQAQFPFLAANLAVDPGVDLGDISPYTVLDAGPFKIGVLGLTYHDLSTIVKASAIEGIHSLPPAETVERYLPELQSKADLVIVLSHLGEEGDRALAEAVPEIPLIVGGHSHTSLYDGLRIGNTLIVQAGAYGAWLGQVETIFDRRHRELVLDETTARLIPVTDAGAPSEAAAQIVAKWAAEAEQVGSTVVGEAALPLPRSPGSGETALGDMIVDAMRAADLGDGRPADIAVHNDGGIRASLDAGPITYAELYAILPFDNTLVGVDLTGVQVREAIENGMDDQGTGIQVSGLAFTYSMNKPRGRRVMEVTVGGQPLDPEQVYRVVTIDYLYTHPSYRLSLGLGKQVTYGGLCLDAVIDYVRVNSPVSPTVEGRIQRYGAQ